MKAHVVGAGLLLLAPLAALAQPAPLQLAPVPPGGAPVVVAPAADPWAPDLSSPSRFHAEADYLLWFLKPNHIRTPVLNTVIDPNEDLVLAFAAGGVEDPNARTL